LEGKCVMKKKKWNWEIVMEEEGERGDDHQYIFLREQQVEPPSTRLVLLCLVYVKGKDGNVLFLKVSNILRVCILY
jgi:hypothetical protein